MAVMIEAGGVSVQPTKPKPAPQPVIARKSGPNIGAILQAGTTPVGPLSSTAKPVQPVVQQAPPTVISGLGAQVGPNLAAILTGETTPAGPTISTPPPQPTVQFVTPPESAPPSTGATPTGGAAAQPPTPTVAPGQWEDLVLDDIGAPKNSTTRYALELWAQSEGMFPGWNNWLAVKEQGFGGSQAPGAPEGIMRYPSIQDGASATAAVIKQSNMSDILSALRKGDSMLDIFTAINTSPWCHDKNGPAGKCQDGYYPKTIWAFIQNGYLSTYGPQPSVSAPGQPPVTSAEASFGDVAIAAFKTFPAHVNSANARASQLLSAVS